MSRRIFILAALALCLSLPAADIKDTWFETFYEAIAQKLPAGMKARKDPKTRIIFIDMPLPIKSDATFNVGAAEEAVVKKLKGSQDAEFIKKAEITLIYNYITADNKIYSVVVSAKKL